MDPVDPDPQFYFATNSNEVFLNLNDNLFNLEKK